MTRREENSFAFPHNIIVKNRYSLKSFVLIQTVHELFQQTLKTVASTHKCDNTVPKTTVFCCSNQIIFDNYK